MKVPFIDVQCEDPAVQAEIQAKIAALVQSAGFIGGPEVERFAEEFAAYCGGGFCAPVANGTDALILALKALGIRPGDEVLTVPFTFIATAEAVTAVGASVKFVDIDPRTFTMDPALFEKAVSPRTKAVIPVHLFGQPADMDPILETARRHGIKVIEDAAQAHGAMYKGRRVGTIGDAGCFSFYPTKNLGGLGDGGAVVSRDASFIKRVVQIGNHGRSAQYFHDVEGLNSRLDSIQAAALRIKLPHLDQWNARRAAVARRYSHVLNGRKRITPPFIPAYSTPVYHLYCVESDDREGLKGHLKKKEIAHGVYYPLPLHLQPAYGRLGHKKGDFPASERASERILSLPMFPGIDEEEISAVIEALASF